MPAWRRWWNAVATLACATIACPATAQSIDADAFGRWSDATFGKANANGDFSAMGLVMVQDGKTVLTLTYGPASRSPDKPIDLRRTRFLIGSITKTFTGLAIAQMVERRQIRSIDDPVNRYLKRVKLKGRYGERITIRDLLTHSAGFDQRSRDVGTSIARPARSAAKEIERIAPRLVRSPGTLVSYSNYGTGILAVLVEDVTGTPIEDYFTRNIWRPLGMTSAHFQRGLAMEQDLARAYVRKDGGAWQQKPFIAFHPYYWPVGAIGMTLEDAAQYLRFQLAAARGADTPVLSTRAHQQLRARLRGNHPAVGGFGYLMMSFVWNGQPVFGHGGTWPGYESMMLVLPEQNTALFFSITGPAALGNLKAYNLVMSQLLGPYGPPRGTAGNAKLTDYAGVYRPTMRATSGVEGFLPFLGNGDGLRVDAVKDGLMIGGDGPFKPAGRDLFWFPGAQTSGNNPFGTKIYGFNRGYDGRVAFMTPQPGLSPLERVPDWADPSLRAPALRYLGYALFIGLIAVGWRRVRRRDWLAIAASILPPFGLGALPFILTANLGPRGLEAYLLEGQTNRFEATVAIASSITACALVMLYFALSWWRENHSCRPAWNRWSATLIALLQLLTVITLASVNLLGLS